MATKSVMTLEQFEALPGKEGLRYELLPGFSVALSEIFGA
jgi:hypothetical protein